MDMLFTPKELALRDEVRTFIDENLPDEIRARIRRGFTPTMEQIVHWQKVLNKRGWGTPSWPKEYGGPGWTAIERLIFLNETFSAPAPEPLTYNVNLVGPVVLNFGSEEQKREFLPKLANADLIFCQGFSEPNAGSDLAALSTTAIRDGDHYVVNGQKTWTSIAHEADWMFALVRTDPQAERKQKGISFLLIDLKTPGITIRPIHTIDANHHVNEVFFDDVRVPAANLVGEENKGWSYAKFLLSNERVGISRIGRWRERLAYAKQLAREQRSDGRPLLSDPTIQERIVTMEAELKAMEITELRVTRDKVGASSGGADPFSSITKLKGSEMHQASLELLSDIAGPQSLVRAVPDIADWETAAETWAMPLSRAYLHSRAATIYGGSTEIQKNILAKAVLEL